MKLATINRWLRRAGLVLVVETGDAGEPTRLWVERVATYERRAKR